MRKLGIVFTCLVFTLFAVNTVQAQKARDCSKKCSKSSMAKTASLSANHAGLASIDCSKMSKEECAKLCKVVCNSSSMASLESSNPGALASKKKSAQVSATAEFTGKSMPILSNKSSTKLKKTCSKPCVKTKAAKA